MVCLGAAAGALTMPMFLSELSTEELAPGKMALSSSLVYWEGLVPLTVLTVDPPLPLDAGATVTKISLSPSVTSV